MNAVPAVPGPDHSVGAPKPRRPLVIVFDVNETLSDMTAMSERFTNVGAPIHLASLWFARLLRDGFALTAAGASRPFADVGSGLLRVMLPDVKLNRPLDEAVEHIMSGFIGLDVHADVTEGVEALASLGIRLVTLSNGSTHVAEELLTSAGVRSNFEMLLSVDAAGAWKPAAHAYEYALDQCAIDPDDAMLVAVHPWDIDGAHRAGLATTWLNRTGSVYPHYFHTPDVEATSLTQLARLLS
ncbi:haloacid dehalogenase type II [Rhodococcus sp. G-MC3]|uniref:haloacid dehalogenase type II n=1 Tax=Rhodococcus sp. G-MC3 TaxID=3046209 RepID=UPI0024BA4A56|nr:haloacid dehalogenase type II [Rhodococcus sp. G-MC3]MDJ0396142.1 haloacid dehalogenase type II [Rhodococcus sp. G-MC3]